MSKTCTDCSETKELDAFSKGRNQCRSCRSATLKQWRQENKQHIKTYQQGRKGQMLQASREWKDRNPGNHGSNRNPQAQPAWLSSDDLFCISEIYSLCVLRTEVTGVKHEVDHIIPLYGDGVCGLHVPWNLQVLTKQDNCKKGRYYE